MSHFAKVENGIVTQVIVAEKPFIDSGAVGDPTQWIQTSYNTIGGKHLTGGLPLRKNFAGVGYHYDAEADAFYPPQTFPSWILNKATYLWEPPVPRPMTEDPYNWDEATTSWVKVSLSEYIPTPV